MSTAIDLDQAFEGFDSASAEDRKPGIAPSSRSVLALQKLEVRSTEKGGLTVFVDYDVVESTSPDMVPGSDGNYRINGLDKTKKKKMQMWRVRCLVAALFNIDPRSEQKWLDILKKLVRQPEIAKAWLFVAEAGPKTKTEDGQYEFIPVNLKPVEAGHEAMTSAQAKRFQ